MSDAPRRPVLLITGASSGIGRCTAELFARKGWDVGLVARGRAGLEATEAAIRQAGGRACIAEADVSEAEALDKAADRTEQELGPIAAWVNCAGVSAYGRFMDLPEADYERVTRVTYLGVVNGTRSALRRMLPRDEGRIVNIGSAVAMRAVPLQSAYSAAKYAVAGFTEAVRAELIEARSRVQLGIVHPPSTNTPFFSHASAHLPEGGVPRPPPPVYAPEIVAEAIHLAVSSGRRSVRVTAQPVMFAAANALMPGALDWLLGHFGASQQVSHDPRVAAQRDETLFQPSGKAAPVQGPFSGESLRHSLQMSLNRNPLASIGLGVAALAFLAMQSRR
ncbi:SDR family oxidoreductase [Pseudoroseomonas cervicalis]|uniref:SDR family oxidoreductase n=1 Tax=Teichococcus cervicalis TaxID=204525 RepID=UPI002781F3A7|nr:SDR family oxidoreductase [Pseudoroseomonas cervicalis]MDQ1081666.1 short-subunit dehydrogenase [Pseudoroseomonas cervicalis]